MTSLAKSLVMDLEIIDNFLPDYQFKSIQKSLTGNMFPWYYNDCACRSGDKRTQFTHTFFSLKKGQRSSQFPLMEPCLPALKAYGLNRIMAVLTVGTLFNRRTEYHVDLDDPGNILTGVFYINTCNGGTKFKGGPKVKSVANRVVIFDTNLKHAAVTCTDKQSRVVVNFNFSR